MQQASCLITGLQNCLRSGEKKIKNPNGSKTDKENCKIDIYNTSKAKLEFFPPRKCAKQNAVLMNGSSTGMMRLKPETATPAWLGVTWAPVARRGSKAGCLQVDME